MTEVEAISLSIRLVKENQLRPSISEHPHSNIMNNIKPLPKITNLAQFHDDFFLTNQAVVLEGAARTMPAFTKWTDEYLLET